MKKKFDKTGLKIFLIVICCLYLTASYFTIDAAIENHHIQQLITDFKKGAISPCQYSQTYDMNFCKVESNQKDITPTFSIHPNTDEIFIGSRGDLLVSLKAAVTPLINWFMDFYAGGHAALIDGADLNDNQTGTNRIGTLIEITGLNERKEDNDVQIGYNDWLFDNSLRANFVALKVKATKEEREKAMQRAEDMLGDPYNYTFVFNTKNAHYCTDILSKAYAVVDKDLNEDHFITTAQDIIISEDTFIFVYKEENKTIVDENQKLLGTHNVYYLDDSNEYDFTSL